MYYAGKFNVKILAGIVLLVSARMASYMNQNVAGINVPEKLIQEMASAPKGGALEKGIEIAGRMVRQIKEQGICHGVHIMAIGKETSVPAILQAANFFRSTWSSSLPPGYSRHHSANEPIAGFPCPTSASKCGKRLSQGPLSAFFQDPTCESGLKAR
jgi:hypothetical protein